ncbi:hypothetical protein DFH08DRAFT_892161, partial [Mycena albidolilacea]
SSSDARRGAKWGHRGPVHCETLPPPRPCLCVPTLKHECLLGKSAVSIPPRVHGSGPCVAPGASGSHTHIELRPRGRREEWGMCVRPRVCLRCAAAGGESESARGSGNASADAHGLAGDGSGGWAYGVSGGYGDVRAGENGDWGGGECRACTGLNGRPRLEKADIALPSGENGEVGVNLTS